MSFAVALIFGLVNGYSLQIAMVGAIGGMVMTEAGLAPSAAQRPSRAAPSASRASPA